jgi:hypothetical protein
MNDQENGLLIKPHLISLLRDAAEIEQQFMCMYLYGALSMKKRYTDEQQFADISPPQLEETRRWLSTVYLVARQEMEHLALANNLLRSIGGAPYFAHANTTDGGAIAKYFKKPLSQSQEEGCCDACKTLDPVSNDFELRQFDLKAAKAWTCMEAPDCTSLKNNDEAHFAHWCFECKSQAKKGVKRQKLNKQTLLDALRQGNEASIAPGDIADLYDQIEVLFEALAPGDFVTQADQQVTITQQYDIYVYPVTDKASAKQAIDLIIKQGEGRQASATYLSHYRRFYDIAESLSDDQACLDDPNCWDQEKFKPYWSMIENPQSSQIGNQTTRKLFDLFNDAYETLLIMLTSLYALPEQNPQSYPHFAPALGQEAFAPSMTMIIRSLGELLVQLKVNDGDEIDDKRVGPGFIISPDIEDLLKNPYCPNTGSADEPVDDGFAGSQLKPELANIDSMIARFSHFNEAFGQVVDCGDLPVADPDLQDWAQSRLEYIHANAKRIEVNMRRIYQQGVYSALQSEGY